MPGGVAGAPPSRRPPLPICGYTLTMDAVQRLARLEQRIGELAAGKDIDAAHVEMLLAPAQYRVVAHDCLPRDAFRSTGYSGVGIDK